MIRSALLWWSPPGLSEPISGAGWPPSTPRPRSRASAPGPPGSTSGWSIPAAPPATTPMNGRRCATGRWPVPSCWRTATSRPQPRPGHNFSAAMSIRGCRTYSPSWRTSYPVHIVDFVNQSPGGGPASLLRSVDLATVDSSAHLTRAAYLGWIAFIDAQRAEYRPSVQQVRLHTGQTVLRIGYGAPSPLS